MQALWLITSASEAALPAASVEEKLGGQPSAETSEMQPQPQPQPSGASNQERQAGSSTGPALRGIQEKGRHPKPSDTPAILASFLAHTDTVLRFRKAA